MSPQSLNEIIPGEPWPGVQHALSPLERVAVISHVSLWSFIAPSPQCSQSTYCEYHIKVCVYEKGQGHREGGGGTCPWGLTTAILFLSRRIQLFSRHPVPWATGLPGTKEHSQQAFKVLVEIFFCSFKIPGLPKSREKFNLKPRAFLPYSLTLRSSFLYPAELPAPPAFRHQLLLQASPI